MRSRRIARSREARRFRCYRFGGVEASEQALAAGLPRHAHEGSNFLGSCACDAALGHTAVAVAIEHPAFGADGDFVKVEQIAVLMGATLLPDASHALNGIIRGGVDRGPSLAAVVGGRDERVPFARETNGLIVAGRVSAEEANGRAAGAAA